MAVGRFTCKVKVVGVILRVRLELQSDCGDALIPGWHCVLAFNIAKQHVCRCNGEPLSHIC